MRPVCRLRPKRLKSRDTIMGMNNLLSYLRQTGLDVVIVDEIDETDAYDLYIDLAIIIVPLMQRARSIEHFTCLLYETFGGNDAVVETPDDRKTRMNGVSIGVDSCDYERVPPGVSRQCRTSGCNNHARNELVELIVRANSVSMYLDMLSPRMKVETHNYRNLRNYHQCNFGYTSGLSCSLNDVTTTTCLDGSMCDDGSCMLIPRCAAGIDGAAAQGLVRRNKLLWSNLGTTSILGTTNLCTTSSLGTTPNLGTISNPGTMRPGVNGRSSCSDKTSLVGSFNCHGSCVNNGNATTDAAATATTSVRYNVVKLRDVREIIPRVILMALCCRDRTLLDRCIIETDTIGEGEIKCMRSAMQSNTLGDRRQKVVLSNDNDVILMMLMHQPDTMLSSGDLDPIDSHQRTLFYRVLINDTVLPMHSSMVRTGERNNAQFRPSRAVVPVDVKSIRLTRQRIVVDRQSIICRLSLNHRWRFLLYLICCCGTDFVSPIRPFSPNRRIEIFNACHAGLGVPPMDQKTDIDHRERINGRDRASCTAQRFACSSTEPIRTRHCRSMCPTNTISFDIFLDELRRFIGRVNLFCTKNEIADRKKRVNDNRFYDDVGENYQHHVRRGYPGNENGVSFVTKRRLTLVASWIIRLYWNILYLIDLPVDFFKEPRFPSDLNMLVNCYVPNEYISIFSILLSLSDEERPELRKTIDRLLYAVSPTDTTNAPSAAEFDVERTPLEESETRVCRRSYTR